eukprot:GHVU01203108.1.p1 GENE.GHVU01203108.1~~GHVU01203108.1.p1  ORF type:complete len:189 (+),score=21.54 GHVU01203108.1:623-1189(+)
MSHVAEQSMTSAQRKMALKEAVATVQQGVKSAAQAAADAGVPRSTMYHNLKPPKRAPTSFHPKAVFTLAEEEELATQLQRLSDMMRPLRSADVRSVAYRFARQRRKEHAYNRRTKQLGRAWFNGFMERHPTLSVQKPQPTSRGRAWGFNKPAVMHFYDLLDGVVKQYRGTSLLTDRTTQEFGQIKLGL